MRMFVKVTGKRIDLHAYVPKKNYVLLHNECPVISVMVDKTN